MKTTNAAWTVDMDERVRQAARLEALGRLVADVAHDLNNMLLVISGYSELVAASVTDDAVRADALEIQRASERAAALTSQLVAFGQQDAPASHLVCLNDVVSGVETLLRMMLGPNIGLGTGLAPELGSVLADRAQLEQILVNLAINARGAMPDGGALLIETAGVRFDATDGARPSRAVPGRDYVRLRLRDSGTGLDAQTRECSFEPFFTTKPLGAGPGLGLAIVRGIAEQGGGFVNVTCQLGAGSTFDVYLPTQPDVASTTSAKARSNNALDVAPGSLCPTLRAPR